MVEQVGQTSSVASFDISDDSSASSCSAFCPPCCMSFRAMASACCTSVSSFSGFGDKTQSRDTEVLIVGAGIAGLSAAIFSAEKGLNTIVIEKRDQFVRVPPVQLGFNNKQRTPPKAFSHCRGWALALQEKDPDIRVNSRSLHQVLQDLDTRIQLKDVQALALAYIELIINDLDSNFPSIKIDFDTTIESCHKDELSPCISICNEKSKKNQTNFKYLVIADGAKSDVSSLFDIAKVDLSSIEIDTNGLIEADERKWVYRNHASVTLSSTSEDLSMVFFTVNGVLKRDLFIEEIILDQSDENKAFLLTQLKTQGWACDRLPSIGMVHTGNPQKIFMIGEIPEGKSNQDIANWFKFVISTYMGTDQYAQTLDPHNYWQTKRFGASACDIRTITGNRESKALIAKKIERKQLKAALNCNLFEIVPAQIKPEQSLRAYQTDDLRLFYVIGDAAINPYYLRGHGGKDAVMDAFHAVESITSVQSQALLSPTEDNPVVRQAIDRFVDHMRNRCRKVEGYYLEK